MNGPKTSRLGIGDRKAWGKNGVSPKGRPKGLQAAIRQITDPVFLAEIAMSIAKGEGYLLESGQTLMPTMGDIKWAVEYLSDRGWGKAPIHVAIDDASSRVDRLVAMTDDQLEQLDRLLTGVTLDAEFVDHEDPKKIE